VKEWLAQRPEPADPADANLVFLTHHGSRWIREWKSAKSEAIYFHDYIASEFRKLLKKAGIERRGEFYNLRHTWRTIADASKDQVALDCVMGHLRDSMAEEYRRFTETPDADDRLKAVVNVVRNWLWRDQDGPATIPFSANAG
jgi:hypothetical protein